MRVPPWPIVGIVTGHDPSNDAVTVSFPTLQMPGISIRRLYDGYADPLRISKKSLPARGTHGLVVFPHGDLRNPVWLGSFNQNLADAIPSNADDPFMEYDSHFSGHWNLLDQHGNFTTVFADGSSLAVNASGTVPTVFRHVVDQNQAQQRVEYPQSTRNPNPPPPFALVYTQAASGSSGGTSIGVDSNGNVSLSCSTTGHTATISYNGATLQIDANGNVVATPKSGSFMIINGDLHATGDVVAGFGGGDSVTLQSHTHGGVTAGSGHTLKPDAGT